jgi:hypothetical protein
MAARTAAVVLEQLGGALLWALVLGTDSWKTLLQ